MQGIKARQSWQTSRGVTVLRLLPVSEADSSGQLRDLLGTTRVPVLDGDCPLGWGEGEEVRWVTVTVTNNEEHFHKKRCNQREEAPRGRSLLFICVWESHQTPTGCLERGCGRRSPWPRPPPYRRPTRWIQIPEEPSSAAWETPFPAMRIELRLS